MLYKGLTTAFMPLDSGEFKVIEGKAYDDSDKTVAEAIAAAPWAFTAEDATAARPAAK